MGRYLDPKADLTFKKIFGEHKHLVISLLNALLPLDPDKKIESIEYLPSELVPRTPTGKDTIVDVRCEETGGRKFIVEMQMSWTANFKQRVLLNASKAYVRQLPKGEEYHLLQPVYSLNLVNEIFEPEMEEYYHYYPMVHYQHPEKVLEGLHLVFVELPKFKAKNFTEKKMEVLWLRFLTEIGEDTRQAPQDLLDTPETSEALEIIEESAYSDAEMLAYDKFWDRASREKTLKGDMARTQAALEAAEAKLNATNAMLDTANAKLDTANAELNTANAKLDTANAELNTANAKLDTANAKLDAANAELDAAKNRICQTVRNLKALNLTFEQIAAATGIAIDEIAELQ